MGNFYVNIVLRESDIEVVASTLGALRRRAYVAADGAIAVVFDERCDDQDQGEIESLARALSKELRCTALAFLNHDDDVLWYALVEEGKIVDRYDSFPGYFTGGSDTPHGDDASRLCAAFHVTEHEGEVAALLARTHRDMGLEIDRHTELLELLHLPAHLAVFGYRYVSAGELAPSDGDRKLRAIGGAPAPQAQEGTARSAPTSAAIEMSAETAAALRAEAPHILANTAVLAFNQVAMPAQFVDIFGSGSVNAYVLMLRLQRYVASQALIAPLGMVKANAVLAELLGEREFLLVALPRLLRGALGLPMLSAEDQAALRDGKSPLFSRLYEALRLAAEEAGRE